MIRQLPDCHHHFHLDCIGQWLATHTTCPMCRRSLLPPDPNTQAPVSPSGSPTAHLLPLWASSARSQQHQELAVELRPVSCPPPISPLFDTLSDLVMYVLAACMTLQHLQSCCSSPKKFAINLTLAAAQHHAFSSANGRFDWVQLDHHRRTDDSSHESLEAEGSSTALLNDSTRDIQMGPVIQ